MKNPYFSALPILKDRKIDLILTKDFLEISKTDFEVSKLLFKNKQYNYAINFLQQSVEKLVKAYLLKIGIISKKELYEISHSTPQAFLKLLEDKGVVQISSDLKDVLSTTIEKDKQILKSLLDAKEETYARLTKEEILNFIALVKNLDTTENEKAVANPELVYDAFKKLYPDKNIKTTIKINDLGD